MTLPLVVDPAELAAAGPDSVKIVDLRPDEARQTARIPGSRALPASFLNRLEPPVGGRLPDAATLDLIVRRLDLVKGDHLVAVDSGSATEAARLIWVLHACGFADCSWLDGGMRAWEAAGLPLDRGAGDTSRDSSPSPDVSDAVADARAEVADAAASDRTGTFTGGASSSRVESGDTIALAATGTEIVDADTLHGELEDPDLIVLDVRGAAEYAGTDVRAAEGGHIPGARHLEWTRLLDANGRLLPVAELRALFDATGLTSGKRAVVYCQTHQRSAVTWLALKHLGHDTRALDGAWSAWGNRPDLPKTTTVS